MFELADRLVGIYKTHNTTKSVAINPNAIEKKADEAENQNPAGTSANSNTTVNVPPNMNLTAAV